MDTVGIEELIYSCMLAPPSERRNRLHELCSTHPSAAAALRAQFDRLRLLGLISLGEDGEAPGMEPALPAKLGPYRIDGILGAGGGGVVYRGHQPNLGDRPVAVKALRPELLGNARGEARFVREGLLAARLQHPNLCPVLDVGKDQGVAYLAMPLIEGGSLAGLLERARQQGGSGPVRVPLATSAGGESGAADWRAVVALIETLARAVHYAHDKGLVHRDIKPGNVVVRQDGAPVLLDFGLARDLDAGAIGLTGSAELLGTPAYMAPEQADPRGRVTDARTDVYGLGATLYEALTLRLPHEAASRNDLLRHIAEERAVPLACHRPELPRDLATIVEVALERDPGRRFATAAALADDLHRLLAGEPVLARRPGPVARARRWLARNRVAAALIAVLAAGLWASLHFARAFRSEAKRHEVTAKLAQSEALRFSSRSFEAFGAALAARDLDPASPATLAALQELMGAEREVVRFELQPGVRRFAPHPRGDRVAFAIDGGLAIHALFHAERPAFVIDGASTTRCAWLRDGGLVVAGRDGVVRRHDESGAVVWQTAAAIAESGDAAVGMEASYAKTGSSAVLAVGGEGGRLLLLDLDSGRTIHERSYKELGNARIDRVVWAGEAAGVLLACSQPRTGAVRAEHQVFWAVPEAGGLVLLATHQRPVSTLVASAHGWFASHSGDGRLLHVGHLDGRQHGIAELGELLAKNVSSAAVRGVALHGARLAVAVVDEVQTFDLERARAGAKLPHAGAVSGLAFAHDGRALVTCSSDGLVQRWDLRIGVRVATAMQSPSSELLGLAALENDAVIVGADENRVHVVAAPPPPYLRLQLRSGFSQLVPVWDGDERFLVSRVGDGTVERFDRSGTSHGEVRFPGQARLLAGEPPEPIVFGTGPRGSAFAHFDPETGERRAVLELAQPDGLSLMLLGASASRDGARALVLRATPGTEITHVTTLRRAIGSFDWQIAAEGTQRDAPLRHACVLSDGRAVLAGQDGTLSVTASDSIDTVRGLWRHATASAIRFVAASPDENVVLAGCADGAVALVDIASGLATPLQAHTATVVCAAFARDGLLAATGDATGRIALWSLARGELVCCWRAHAQRVRHVAFSPSAECLLTSGFDGAVCLWPVDPADIDRLAQRCAPRIVRVGSGG